MSEMLTCEQAIARFSEFGFGVQAKIQSRSVSSPEAIQSVARKFLERGASQGWSYDEDWAWHQAEGTPARSVDAMMEQYVEWVLKPMDGKLARQLRDKFLEFVPEAEHAPLIEGLYAAGMTIDADGNVHGG